MRILPAVVCAALAIVPAVPQSPPVLRVAVVGAGSTGLVPIQASEFARLAPQQQSLAYWLSRATLALDPILYDQISPYGGDEKRLFDLLALRRDRIPSDLRPRLLQFIQLFWINHGTYNRLTGDKFLPAFSPSDLLRAARAAGIPDPDAALDRLRRPLFDPAFLPRSIPPSETPPRADAAALTRAVQALRLAEDFAPPSTRRSLRDLVAYYQSLASPAAASSTAQNWNRFAAGWGASGSAPVVFLQGFLGPGGLAQGWVAVRNPVLDAMVAKLAANAAYFERHQPWAPVYRNPHPDPLVPVALEPLVAIGDFDTLSLDPTLASREISLGGTQHAFLFSGARHALDPVVNGLLADAFNTLEQRDRAARSGKLADTLFVALRTVIGTNSGRVSSSLHHHPPDAFLREYYATLEQSRLDLVALWALDDPKLVQLGLLSHANAADVAHAAYDAQVRTALLQSGGLAPAAEASLDAATGDHLHCSLFIVNYIRATTGAIQPRSIGGQLFLEVTNYDQARRGAGMLLAELMRIKAQGDYRAMRRLVARFGVSFDPAWSPQIRQRLAALDLPSDWAPIYPALQLNGDSVFLAGPVTFLAQRLNYAALNHTP